MVWKIKKEEPTKVEVPTNEDLDLEEARIREQLRKLEERKVVPDIKPKEVKQESRQEPDVSKDEVFDMILGNFNSGLYLLNVYRSM